MRPPVLVRAQAAAAATSCTASTKWWAASPTAAWAGSTWRVDRAVSDRWVVLKGLLDTGDQDAMAAAISERRFLAEIEHPNIVRIYNFVEHLDQRTGSLDGYIVMEYVGGKSLKEIANERRDAGTASAIRCRSSRRVAYGIEALEALGHLHSRNLLYCDFKVDNAIQQQDQLKLIDMGAVRRMDDDESAIYGTVGYQAPEVAEVGPSVASDLYTVARTLAVLTFDFQGYRNASSTRCPPPDDTASPGHESLHRFLLRATDPDPAPLRLGRRDGRAARSVLLREEVAARGDVQPRSPLFGPDVAVGAGGRHGGDARLASCPSPRSTRRPRRGHRPRPRRPAAARRPIAPLRPRTPVDSPEVFVRTARAHLASASPTRRRRDLDRLGDLRDWRLWWHRGLVALATGRATTPSTGSTRSAPTCQARWRPGSPSRWPPRPGATSIGPRGCTPGS